MTKYFKFTYKKENWHKPLEGGAMTTDSMISWFFNAAPYGVKLVSFEEVNKEDFLKLPDYTSEFKVYHDV